MSDTLRNKKIHLTTMTAFHSKQEKLPEDGTTVEVIESDEPLNMVKVSASVWYGRKCPFDNLNSYPQKKKLTFFLYEQIKSTLKQQKVKKAVVKRGSIKEERKKAFQTGKKIFSDHELFFSFVSNARLETPLKIVEKTILNDNKTMITSRDQFEDRYSPMFSCIAKGDED